MFTKALHCSLTEARCIQSIAPLCTSLRSALILSSRLRVGLPISVFPPGFPTKILYVFSFSPRVLHALPIASPWLDHCNYIWWSVQVAKLLAMQFSLPSYYFIPLGSKPSGHRHVTTVEYTVSLKFGNSLRFECDVLISHSCKKGKPNGSTWR
jgi:hypothetical protein